MTTIFDTQKKCATCGTPSVIYEVGSTNSFGSPDMDTRPPEMKIIELNPTYDLRYCAPLLAKKNILLIGGWEDVNVTIDDQLLPLYRAIKNEKNENVEFIVYHTNHSFSNVRDKLAEDIIKWLKRN